MDGPNFKIEIFLVADQCGPYWECWCVGGALVRVTSRSFPVATTNAAADAQTFRPRILMGCVCLVS